MCGIAGFTTIRASPDDPRELIRQMAQSLRPRGPDGDGYDADSCVTLGHRRLSIIDLEGGAQPMSTEDGRYCIVYNGEIYNYIELRRDLEARGCVFRTTSDTEVLLRQFALDGADALQKLEGMFSLAIWDRQRRELFLARDRIGIKPLYYCHSGGELAFASELKALLKHPNVPRKIDPLSVSKFFTFGYVPTPHTIFEGVDKLEAGTYLRFNADGLHKRCYWDIPPADQPGNGRDVEECIGELLQILQASVGKHLRSDVPVSVLLSGGIDSSTITAFAARASKSQLHSFTIGFEEQSYDESLYAREVAQRYGTNHHHEVLSLKRAVELLPSVMQILDEPFADASILPTYLLSQLASRHVKVVLSGDGGDELFAGYPAFQAHKIMDVLSALPPSWVRGLNRCAQSLPVSHQYGSVQFLLQQFFKGRESPPEIRFFHWLGYYGNEEKKRLLSPACHEAIADKNPFEDIANYIQQSRRVDDLEKLLYLCTKLYLQDGILVKVDRASMANSLEVRVPFLDHRVVEHAAGIPSAYKLKRLTTKYILKRAARDLLPRRITHRRKAGFMMPVATWLGQGLRPMVEELCAPSALAEDGLLNPKYIRQLLDEHFHHERDHRRLIWPLFCYLIWRKDYAA
jgi:asparagine synthase (glutamine-hydrolysing)